MLTGGGAPYFVVQLVLQGAVVLLVDPRILAEYDEVTARPRFGINEVERRKLLDVLTRVGEPVIASPTRISLSDPDDRAFVEVAIAGGADAIVTGNTKHFIPKKSELPVSVLTPRQLVDRLRR